jgi:ribonuclease-3
VARLLLERYPDAAEGPLTSRSQVLVSRPTLAAVAVELDLPRHLRTDEGMAQAPGELSAKVQADACEALIGAIFADGGLAAAEAFIARFWAERIAGMASPPRDPKMALQEWALERALPLPRYTVLASAGPPHAPSFRIEAAVEGQPSVAAEGSSKRRAEQAAAALLLARIGGRG